MDDEKMIQLFFSRSEEAITSLQEKYGRLCRSVAAHILPDERDIAECVSDVALKVWNSIPPERPKSMAAYVSRITRNTALDKYDYNAAGKRATALTEAFEELEGVLVSSVCDVEKTIEAKEFRKLINEFLRKQTKEDRVFFVRRYWYGDSIAEIAAAFGAGEEKVKSSLFRTRNRLKLALEKEGIKYES